MYNNASAPSDIVMETAPPFSSDTVCKPEINDTLRSVDGLVPIGMSPYAADYNLNKGVTIHGHQTPRNHIGFYPVYPLVDGAATSHESHPSKSIGFKSYTNDMGRILSENNPESTPLEETATRAPKSHVKYGLGLCCLGLILFCVVLLYSLKHKRR